jgi:hypothetical protein
MLSRLAGFVYSRRRAVLCLAVLEERGEELVREGNISEQRFEETTQEARAARLVDPHERGEVNEGHARLKRGLAEGG